MWDSLAETVKYMNTIDFSKSLFKFIVPQKLFSIFKDLGFSFWKREREEKEYPRSLKILNSF